MKSIKAIMHVVKPIPSMKNGISIRKNAKGRCSNQGYQLFHPSRVPVFSKMKSKIISFNNRIIANNSETFIPFHTL
jgi:hypothetical protein